MRDLDRWKDKVELQLDGRQIFFLFFGSAICACLIFVLGVMVGKRVEARAQSQVQAPADDPLAALDELGSAEEGLTFHSALTDRREPRRVKAAASAMPLAPPPPEAAGESGVPDKAERADKSDRALEGGKKEGEGQKAVAGREPARGAVPALPKEARDGQKVARDLQKDPKDSQKEPKEASKEPKEAQKEPKDGQKDAREAQKEPKGKSHFTLQLSAFATKPEASDFMRRLREAGYKPFIIESMIPGKGLMYRVRLGDFTTRDSALSAKGDFERKQKMVAYVAKL